MSSLLLLWLAIELVFYVRYRAWVRARSAEPHATYRGTSDAAEALEILWKPLTSEFPPDMVRNILESWFVGDGDVCYEDVVDLYAWTLHNKRGDGLSRTQRRAADEMVHNLERRLGDSFSAGHGGRTPLAYTFEDLQPYYKPLVWFLFQYWCTCTPVTALVLRPQGFVLRRAGALQYWHRPARDPDGSAPLVFCHGVGGQGPYFILCRTLATSYTGDILLPMFTSSSMVTPPWREPPPCVTPAETVAGLQEMVRRHAPPGGGALWLGHSIGCAWVAALVRAHPSCVAAATFVDPICFGLFHGKILHNFLYARASGGGTIAPKWYHRLQQFFVSGAPDLQYCFRKQFWWTHYVLSPSQLPCAALVILSEYDTVADVGWVSHVLSQRKRRDSTLRVEMREGWYHGAVCFLPAAQRTIVRDTLALSGSPRVVHTAAGKW